VNDQLLGYNIVDLAKESTFEEVYFLLLYERLPTAEELSALRVKIHGF
jgi:citrate synthase